MPDQSSLIADVTGLLDSCLVSGRSPRNFRTYAAIEATNVFLLPAMALLLAPPVHTAEMVSMASAIGACVGFLLVGALYWRGVDQRLRRANRTTLVQALNFADRVEIPFLLLTVSAAAALMYALWLHGPTRPLIGAAVLTLLSGLEYVNYYHWQLQHFDRWSDFKRLVATGQLRRSHMARALAAYRTSGEVRRS